MSEYKRTVKEITDLNWQALDESQLQRLMYISYIAAREFAEALKIALEKYPKDPKLAEMAEGELKTDNLRFADYNVPGDHADFLEYFLLKAGFKVDQSLAEATLKYLNACRGLDSKSRAMTIFSREHELNSIFEAILQNDHWKTTVLEAFKYYLQRHIELDTGEGGHADLTDQYPIDDSVLPFYTARLELYRVIPELFKK